MPKKSTRALKDRELSITSTIQRKRRNVKRRMAHSSPFDRYCRFSWSGQGRTGTKTEFRKLVADGRRFLGVREGYAAEDPRNKQFSQVEAIRVMGVRI